MTSSEEKKSEPNNQLIQQLATGLQSTSALIQGLLREIRENSLSLASFEGELSGLQRTVTSLNRVLQEGDGKASILTRVALLESHAKEMAKDLRTMAKDLKAHLEEQKREAEKARGESMALLKQEKDNKMKVRLGKVQMAGLIGPSVLAFIISVLALFLR